MEFGFSSQEKELIREVREFFSKEIDLETVRSMEDDDRGYDPGLWKKMVKNGWMGLLVSDEYGGEGMTLLDMAILLEEMGFSGYEGPFFNTAIAGVLLLEAAGSAAQKKAILPKVAAGKKILALAYLEPDASPSIAGIRMAAVDENGTYRVTGTKLFVPYAHIADLIICTFRTGETDPNDGVSLFLIDKETPGVTMEKLASSAPDHPYEISFDDVILEQNALLGPVDKGGEILERVLQQAAAAKSVEMAGGARRVLKISVEYAKQREQFDRPIGSFQAIQHQAADMVTYSDTSRFLAYKTCWVISEGLPYTKQAAMCKAWVSDSYRKLVALGHQIMGGFGFMEEADHPIFFKKAKVAELAYGDANFYREIVAREMGL